MSFKFVFWMIALLVISVIVETCGFLFGATDTDAGDERQRGTMPKDD